MMVFRAIVKGLLRMAQRPGLISALWLAALLCALPLALTMEETIRSDVGASLIHRDLQAGLDLGWLEEFQSRAGAAAKLLQPVRVSPAMVFANYDLWLTGGWATEVRLLTALIGLFLLVWIALQGGVLTMVASPDLRFEWSTFLAASGRYFFRFLRLALIMGVAYFGIYKLAHWLFPAIERWTRDVTVETTVLVCHLGGVVLVAILMSVAHLVADFAKISTLREKRRSMVLAIGHSVRVVGRHPLQATGLLIVMFLILLGLQLLYFWSSPGTTGTTTIALVLAISMGQVYLWMRWGLRVARYGAEIELYDRWTGRPAPDRGNSEQEA